MLRRGLIVATLIVAAAAGGMWFITQPKTLPASDLASGYEPDLINGRVIFIAGNCSGCHATPGQSDRGLLGGGLKLRSPFGVFVSPNISSDKRYGIGNWTEAEFANAMKRGTGRRGEHLYPAFPYGSYSLLKMSDVRDLFAYMRALPAVAKPAAEHDLKFPYGLRPTVGVWKLLYFKPKDFQPDPTRSAAWNRGAYLAEGPAHCAQCHTPRNALGALETNKLYIGAAGLELGDRFASNITSSKDGTGDWSEEDIADFLMSGTDKCFNEPTGMAEVTQATSQLPRADVVAIAAYIHALSPKDGNGKHKIC
jgi:mono/diheme cytochrome c family protein